MRLDEMELPYLAMETNEVASNPWPHIEAVRKEHPWIARCAFGYVVHEYKAIDDLLRMGDEMLPAFEDIVEAMNAKDTPWGNWTERHILATSGATHKRMRDTLSSKFTPRQANRNRELMRQVITELLDEWAPKGEFDFEHFASHFPISVMCNMIGISADAFPSLQKSLETLGLSASLQLDTEPALQKAFLQMDEFVQKIVAERRAGQRLHEEPDIMDDLLEAVAEGGLTERELYDLLIFLFAAGYDTSKNALTLIMDRMIENPAMYERCARELDFCHRVMEETFRYNNSSTLTRRAETDVEYRGLTIPKGTTLFFLNTTGGRDPIEFERPDVFDPERSGNTRHLAFGRGPHICLGQFIARAQISEGLHLIAQRIKNPERTGPSGWRPFFGVWGMRGLPIRFTSTEASAAKETA